jgi:hypothetical protein
MNVLRTGTLDAGWRGGRIIGIQIVLGKAYNAEDGRTSLGNITTQSASSLKLGGCE